MIPRSMFVSSPRALRFTAMANSQVVEAPARNGSQKSSTELNSWESSSSLVLTSERPTSVQRLPNS